MSQTKADLESAIRGRDFAAAGAALDRLPSFVAADLLGGMPDEDRISMFRTLPPRRIADLLVHLPLEAQRESLRSLGARETAAVFGKMAPDDRTRILYALPAAERERLLDLLDPGERAAAVRLLGYPTDSVGRLATSDYVRLSPGWTVAQALDNIRRYGSDSETLDFAYVVDDQHKLIDGVHIRKLLLADPGVRVADLMDHSFVALSATDDQEAAIDAMRRSDLTVLPVTDADGVLIGIVTVDDVLDVAAAEAVEDIQKLGGMQAFEEPYLQVAFTRMVGRRAGWLVILFLGEMLTATAMGFFEAEIEKAVVLALFVPLIISSGGNSGSQAATLVVSAMAVGEIQLRDWWRVMRREVFSGLALGVILGMLGFLRIALWSAFSDIYGEYWLLIALTVGIALVGIVLWGTLAGSMLPFGLRRVGLDPAASSAPFVATLVDVTGLVIYFSTAVVILRGTVL